MMHPNVLLIEAQRRLTAWGLDLGRLVCRWLGRHHWESIPLPWTPQYRICKRCGQQDW